MSGTDLERLSTTIDGTTTLDEAKKEEKDDSGKGQDAEESKEESKKENKEESKEDEVKETLPMKWIFLKITLKK